MSAPKIGLLFVHVKEQNPFNIEDHDRSFFEYAAVVSSIGEAHRRNELFRLQFCTCREKPVSADRCYFTFAEPDQEDNYFRIELQDCTRVDLLCLMVFLYNIPINAYTKRMNDQEHYSLAGKDPNSLQSFDLQLLALFRNRSVSLDEARNLAADFDMTKGLNPYEWPIPGGADARGFYGDASFKDNMSTMYKEAGFDGYMIHHAKIPDVAKPKTVNISKEFGDWLRRRAYEK
ncbi:hypothetical protein CC86DRAFT_410168 [Ophiobolus disseminans]|uniref:Uncharacterized protein n=1 Tax=Ophiobolus disseminans TaxID=1469910 RepID=A0A6A6ZPP7_9PLEO|nr:hypothetical protein CC86DRAFT_410168 [Ophiobolus disseminans]